MLNSLETEFDVVARVWEGVNEIFWCIAYFRAGFLRS
jgi:hypothetical protein